MMGGIFGLFHRDARPATPQYLQSMQEVFCEDAANHDCTLFVCGCAGLGQATGPTAAEQKRNRLPATEPTSGFSFVGFGRVDNRTELAGLLGLSLTELERFSDIDLLRRAYQVWGDRCPERIYGNWAFAAWRPDERQLFLARDHFGYVSIHYYIDENIFAFASSRQALLALNLAPIKLNEEAFARTLVSWQGYDSQSNIYCNFKELPPAHSITITPFGSSLTRFWSIENTPVLRLSRRDEYVEAFREVFDEAVRCRLRNAGKVCVTLSGGLDSGAVAATAAGFLSARGNRLAAFTSVPAFVVEKYVEDRFGDELPLARTTTAFAGNIDHYPCPSTEISPIGGIRRALQLIQEPFHAAGNMFWLLDILLAAQAKGCRTILGGLMGNAGISWTGDTFSQPVSVQLRFMGLHRWGAAQRNRLKNYVVRTDPFGAVSRIRFHLWEGRQWWRKSAIHLDFARRMNLLDKLLAAASEQPPTDPLQVRLGIIRPMGNAGSIMARLAKAHGIDFRDPTADARVLAFTLSVPDEVFIDPVSGVDRWLVREAMKGRLPEEVRMNRLRGRQSGDMVPRLRACCGEVETALNELSAGPAAEYLDIHHMRRVWDMVRKEDTPQVFYKSNIILNRGICAGLFINWFFGRYGC